MRPVLVLSLVLPFFLLSTPIAAQTPPAAQVVAQDAVICLHVSRPKAILDLLAGKEMIQAVTSSPFYQGLSSQPKFKEFLSGIKLLETSLETDWRTGLARLTGGGITIAVCPQDTVVAIIDAEDENILQKLHEIILNISRSQAEQQGHPERVASREYGGVAAWTFDGKEAHAVVGKRFLFASRAEGLKTMLDLRGRSDGKNLATNPAFQAAKKAADSQAAATVFVDLKPLMGIPNVAGIFERQRANPLAALVFAGVMESLRNSNWLSLELNVEGKTLAVRALTDGKITGPANPAAFALPQEAGDGAWPNLSVPRRIAAVSLYRDLHGFYAAKDTLFPDRSSGLIFFENMMGIFFTGRDLTSEVLAETEPEIRMVVAEQQYDLAGGTPRVQIPAFAAILRLRHPEQFDRVVEEAWQKAVGLINFTRGQKAMPGLIIDRPVYKETKYTVACFSPADANDKAKPDTRFNVRPALAMPGKYLILSSSDGLARDLIDALGREGSFSADDIVRMVLERSATSRTVVRKLYRWLISETEEPADTLIAPLAESFAKDRNVAKLVETMLRSNLFFSEASYRQRVKCPAEFAVGIVKALEGMVSATQLAQDVAGLGQDLCHPPTVKGWAGGRYWINTATLVRRHNLALAVVQTGKPYDGRLDPWAVARKHGRGTPESAGRFLLELLLQDDLEPATREALLQNVRTPTTDGDGEPGATQRRLAHAVMTLPEYHSA